MNPSSGLIILLQQLTELRETPIYIYQFIKAIIKNTDEQPEAEIHRVRSGRALSFCPCGAASASPSRCVDVVIHLQVLRAPYY